MRRIGILQGLSEGLFWTAAILVSVAAIMSVLVVTIQVAAYRAGRMRFMDIGPMAQWVVLTFFNDGGDGGGFA